MSLKETKIFIPEIPPEWTQRTRAGHTNIWNDGFFRSGLPEIKLEPPIVGLYAQRFDDGWYWVCGCHTCLGNGEPYSYIVCEEHNRCLTCNTHRSELKEAPWGKREGFQCTPCAAREHNERKRLAIKEAKRRGHSEDDCYYTDDILCPVCGSKNSDDDIHGKHEHEVNCCICDTNFFVTVEYEPKYTSKLNG